MATVIRMARHGTKKRPYYRLVVQCKTKPRDGRFIEHIGAFNPFIAEGVTVERPRLEYWLSVGAKMSDTVASLLKPTIQSWAGATPTTEAPADKPAPKAKKPAAKKSAEA